MDDGVILPYGLIGGKTDVDFVFLVKACFVRCDTIITVWARPRASDASMLCIRSVALDVYAVCQGSCSLHS